MMLESDGGAAALLAPPPPTLELLFNHGGKGPWTDALLPLTLSSLRFRRPLPQPTLDSPPLTHVIGHI